MKTPTNLFKRIAASLVAAAVLGGSAASTFAAGGPSFNSIAGDQEFLTGRNVTQNAQGFTDPVTATGGDIVDVAVYYHNAAEDLEGNIAKNVKIKINVPTTDSTSHKITGSISADNAPTVTGTVVNGQEVGAKDLTITTGTANTKLSYVPGSVRWYPNRMTTTGGGAQLPFGQNGDSIVTTGVNLGDLRGCFQYSGFIILSVKVEGETQGIIKVDKKVRKANTDHAFVAEIDTNPGQDVEYRIKVTNVNGTGVARNVRLYDQLEQGLTYVGPTFLTRNGVTTQLPDGITTQAGIQVVADLKPLEEIYITFKANVSVALKNQECRLNIVRVNAENAVNPAEDGKAKVCVVTSTPTPSPTPTATPKPELPKTGPEVSLISLLGIGGLAGTAARQMYLKKQLKKSARKVNVI
jgi:fimbrial isopeptide formation D2 family protein